MAGVDPLLGTDDPLSGAPEGFLAETPEGTVEFRTNLRGTTRGAAPTQVAQATNPGVAGAEVDPSAMSDEELDAELNALAAEPPADPENLDPSELTDAELDAQLQELSQGDPGVVLDGQENMGVESVPYPQGPINRAGAMRYAAEKGAEQDEVARRRAEYIEDKNIDTESASLAARFNIGLVTGVSDMEPEVQAEVLRRALRNDLNEEVEVKHDKGLNQFVYRPEGQERWRLVRGMDWQDAFTGGLAELGPEIGVFASGVAGNIGGGLAGTYGGPAAPLTVPTGFVAGGAVGEAVAEYTRLIEAKNKGLIDWSDQEIYDKAKARGKFAGLTGAAGYAAGKVFGSLIKRMYGADKVPKEIADRFDEIGEGADATADLQARATALTGKEFPMSAGQQAGAPEALNPSLRSQAKPLAGAELRRGESAARRAVNERVGGRLRSNFEKQMSALNAADAAVFAAKDNETIALGGDAVKRAVRAHEQASLAQRVSRAQANKAQGDYVVRRVGKAAKVPDVAADAARGEMEAARETVFRPFQAKFDQLAQSELPIPLAPMRDGAEKLIAKYGQKVLPSLSLKQTPGAGKLLDEAAEAGLSKAEKMTPEEQEIAKIFGDLREIPETPSSLGEMQRLIANINLRMRDSDMSNMGKKLLGEIKDLVERTVDEGLPHLKGDIAALRMGYAAAVRKYEQGIVGQVLEKDRWGGYIINGDRMLDKLLETPAVAREFINSILSKPVTKVQNDGLVLETVIDPASKQILGAVQDGILGKVYRQFMAGDGPINYKGLGQWLDAHKSQLDLLFRHGVDPDVAAMTRLLPRGERASLEEIRRFAKAADDLTSRKSRAHSAFRERFGYATGDVHQIVGQLMQDGRVTEIGVARRMVQRYLGDAGAAQFDLALQAAAYNQIRGGSRNVTADAIDNWWRSAAGEATRKHVGPKWENALRTYRDMLRVVDMGIPKDTTQAVSARFRDTPVQDAVINFLHRATFGTLSREGAMANAVRKIIWENNKERLGTLLADPDAILMLERLTKIPLFTSDGKLSQVARPLMGRLGLMAFEDEPAKK
jgi:hypothetical protein